MVRVRQQVLTLGASADQSVPVTPIDENSRRWCHVHVPLPAGEAAAAELPKLRQRGGPTCPSATTAMTSAGPSVAPNKTTEAPVKPVVIAIR